jgi:regulator of protease activity HflC (stomatin/prohibitin superfamily)
MSSQAMNPTDTRYPPARLTWRWVILLIVLFFVNAVLVPLTHWTNLWANLFLILSIAIIFTRGPFYPYRRFVYYLVVPFLIAWTLSARLLLVLASNPMTRQMVPFLFTGRPETLERSIILWSVVIGLLVAALISASYVVLNQYQVAALTGLDNGSSRGILFSLLFNTNYPYLLVKDGQVTVQAKSAGILRGLGGPGLIIVSPGNAVVLESGGKITRVEIGGIVRQRNRFETIFKVVNLTPRDNVPRSPAPEPDAEAPAAAAAVAGRKKERNTLNLLTKDRISLDMDVVVFFNIRRIQPPAELEPPFGSQAMPNGDRSTDALDAYQVSKEDVLLAATGFSNWEKAVPALAQATLRDVVGQLSLDELFEAPSDGAPPRLRRLVCREVQEKTNAVVEPLGVTVTAIVINEVDLPADIGAQVKAQWLAEGSIFLAQKRREVALVNSKSESETLENINAARARAQTMLLSQIAEGLRQSGSVGQASKDLMLWLRFIEALETVANDPSTKVLFPYGLPFKSMEAMRDLSDLESGQNSMSLGPASDIPDAFREQFRHS